jgi:hypothetical protein
MSQLLLAPGTHMRGQLPAQGRLPARRTAASAGQVWGQRVPCEHVMDGSIWRLKTLRLILTKRIFCFEDLIFCTNLEGASLPGQSEGRALTYRYIKPTLVGSIMIVIARAFRAEF